MTDEIPDDIMQTARELRAEVWGYSRTAVSPVFVIARALMAERAKNEAELATLRAENKQLREALKPFVEASKSDLETADMLLKDGLGGKDDDPTGDYWATQIFYKDLRLARAALNGGE